MRTDINSILFVVAAAFSVAAPVYAQETTDGVVVSAPVAVTQDQVTAACTSPDATEDACLAIIEQYVAYLVATGADQSAIDAAMNDLVVALGETSVPAEIKAVVVAAVRQISEEYVADPELKVALANVADAIEEGDSDTASTGSSPA